MGAFCETVLLYMCFCNSSFEVNDRYHPRYHLAPICGWMNDGNGFSFFKDAYHLFFQFNPLSSLEAGTAHWGHAKSSDLIHWEHLPIAMYPDEPYDQNGVFSGSALIEDEKMYLFYTTQLKHLNETPDHEEHQALAMSVDGVNVKKYEDNPVIIGEEYQPDIRDPKIWKHDDKYYMILGNSFDNGTLGRVLLYESEDKYNWTQVSILAESDGFLGYMWECPDFFELNGYFVLLFSPQGMTADGDKYNNLYETGYLVGNFSYSTYKFDILTDFQELDHGHDFYATQTISDGSGRRIFVAWCDMWENTYPEKYDGFTGHMTIPRTLTLSEDLRLIQQPVAEINEAKGETLRSGQADGGAAITLDDKAGEVTIAASNISNFEIYIESDNVSVLIFYDADNGQISLNRGGDDGLRRTDWKPDGDINLIIYIDASSVELFCGQGEITFSSRFFPDGPIVVRLGDDSEATQFDVISMKRTVNYSSINSQPIGDYCNCTDDTL